MRQLVLLISFLLGSLLAPYLPAQAQDASQQSKMPDWQVAAGRHMEFDVASVKQNKSGLSGFRSNVPLNSDNNYVSTGDLVSVTNFRLANFIQFAYKLTAYQFHVLQLPKWAENERFDIEARAPKSDPTKDQLRLMMQALLADRFKVTAHFETRQLPGFALVLDKAGKTGPDLRRRPDDLPCENVGITQGSPPEPRDAKDSGWLPPACDSFVGLNLPGVLRIGGQHLTMGQIADWLPYTSSTLESPLFDRTGLTGWFDFKLDFAPEPEGPAPLQSGVEAAAPPFIEALKDQLGLKLESTKGPVEMLVIDHVEPPSAN